MVSGLLDHEFVYGPEDAELLSRDNLYQGYVSLDAVCWRHKLFAGGWSDAVRRECLQRPAVAAGLPYDPEQDKVVLLQQARVGALESGCCPWMLEIVAGVCDHPGESLEDLARREAMEEAGLLVDDLKLIQDKPEPSATDYIF